MEPKFFFGIEQVWIDQNFRIPITDKERTLLDGFATPNRFGGMGEVLGLLQENINQLALTKLVEYALQYDKGAVIKRVGWALDQLEVSEKVWKTLQERPVSGYRVLDPTKPMKGKYDSKWMIRNNL